ncbi:autophagy-related protein ATG5 [Acrasis kona]|uniref:Autophagy protein 5 n=1 Tax=Acrasis kona TaxID=1008807 RepID=A0AAW2YP68_9EUKA
MTNTDIIRDSEVRRQIWKGAIPLLINISSHEITSLQTPYPFYVMIPRQSYLPTLGESVRNHFVDYVSTFNKSDLWFECQGEVLKWNLPVGVLFDVHNTSHNLPWSITVHFNAFPTDKIYKCLSESDVIWTYLNTLKEAMYLQYNNVNSIMMLSKNDQTKLWEAIKDNKLNDYDETKEQFKADGTLKLHPIRIVYELNKEVKNELVPLSDEEVKAETLGSFLQKVKPNRDVERTNVVVQGIKPSLETPLDWLIDACSHPDQFLYICLTNVINLN